jgi:hypothetical protein
MKTYDNTDMKPQHGSGFESVLLFLETSTTMKITTVHKAAPIYKDKKWINAKDFIIDTRDNVAGFSPEQVKQIYQNEAQAICNTLWNSLPKGTMDLLVEKLIAKNKDIKP